ncbi:zinc finger CCCH domain-containing protein 62-like isoform X11 [Citrus sinensis]|uniref:zinc finger CCCH domain-containing protein 62-like isoform X11 n=1 Tax=Citrus sinensis TaxID=2711 RepID=UPI002277C157|nr:zinc finger CCCH domain-containing protein 62-like isoform X11 [Citrus sinensis]
MAAPESEQVIFIEEGDDEYSTDSGGSDLGYDSDLDPSYSPLEDTHATFSKLSIGKKSKSRIGKDLDVGVDEIEEKVIQKIIEAGQQEKLKVEQCKVYLRNNGLRLTGNKPTLIQQSQMVVEREGDACTGDVVMFEQNVYKMFNIAACSASGPPFGKRIVAGRIVKESYGAAKQQHTFTIEVLWSKGEKPLPPLRPLLIKGRNLYRLQTLRQRWEDEGERHKVLMEKHSRGFIARSNREIRIHGKEKRKLLKANRMSINQVPKSCQSQMNLIATEKVEILSQQQLALNMDSNQMKNGPQQLSVQPQKPSLSVDHRKVAAQPQLSADSKKAAKLLSQLLEQELAVMQNNCQTQVPQDPIVKLSSIREAPINRQRLKSINHHPPTCPPQEQSCMKQQLCPYYPKGRCYFGDNCKFLHEQRDNGDQRREYRWHHGLPRQFERREN